MFLGTVRDLTGTEVTLHLDYAAYEPMAAKQLDALEADARARWPIGGLAMQHRLGRVEVGEVAVGIAVSTPHRAEAFAATQFLIDRIKEIVPIWKHDTAPDGRQAWIHPVSSVPPGVT